MGYHIRLETTENESEAVAKASDGTLYSTVQVYTDAWFEERPHLTDAIMHTEAADTLDAITALGLTNPSTGKDYEPFVHDSRSAKTETTAATETETAA